MTQMSGFPTLRPAYILKLRVGEGNPVGAVQSGSEFVHYAKGTISTIPGAAPEVNAQVLFAGDWLYFDPDKQHARMNVKGVARTLRGEGINFSYSGVSKVTPELAGIFSGQPRTVPFGLSTMRVIFEVGSERLKELENSTWIGNGRFLYEEGKLLVEVRIAQVVASEDMD
ncbi:DUF3237 domain-containing protein [Aspergillus lucknowensis]|uniref:Uncharacterized protein n=1 Tax=Aspergillus lucknowensis TaxID=176173 RepID=A0ABR4LCV4_9EURO